MKLNNQLLETRAPRFLSGETHASTRFLRHTPLALAMTVAVTLFSPGASAASSSADHNGNIQRTVSHAPAKSDSHIANSGTSAKPAKKTQTLREAAEELRAAMSGFQQSVAADQKTGRSLVVQVE